MLLTFVFIIRLFLTEAQITNSTNARVKNFKSFVEEKERLITTLFQNYNSEADLIYTLRESKMTLLPKDKTFSKILKYILTKIEYLKLSHYLDIPEDSNATDKPKPFSMEVAMQYLKLIEVSEPEEKVSFIMDYTMIWNDHRLAWNPAEFGNITYIYIKDDKLWVPQFHLVSTHELTDNRPEYAKIAQCEELGATTKTLQGMRQLIQRILQDFIKWRCYFLLNAVAAVICNMDYLIRTVDIHDYPRFPVRGLMIDSSRHFLSTKIIKRQIDIMAMNKLNVLHWHLVDSESFPYESKRFPELHKKGAYSPRHVYSRADIADIIGYARLRGIRVMPEFDMPGHTASWSGHEGFLTECLDKEGKWTWPNLIDVTEEKNFKFIDEFLNEVVDTFPDEFLHLGGDEVVDYIADCWDRNVKIQEFMRERGFGNNTELENYFFDRLEKIVHSLKKKRRMVFWQEVSDNNKPDPKAIIHIWKGNTHLEINEQAKNITAKGHQVIISACWYLNYIKYGADWRNEIAGSNPANSRYYYCDPANFTASEEQKKLVLGGIVAIWGEFVDNTNIEARLWPRASAAAERLWSSPESTKLAADAWPRMHELRCRLVARGFKIQPNNNPDYCPFEFDEKY